jgi:hypothetical protein
MCSDETLNAWDGGCTTTSTTTSTRTTTLLSPWKNTSGNASASAGQTKGAKTAGVVVPILLILLAMTLAAIYYLRRKVGVPMPGIATVSASAIGFVNPLYTGLVGGDGRDGDGGGDGGETFAHRSMCDATVANVDTSHYAELGPIATDGRKSLHANPTYAALPANVATDEASCNLRNYAASNPMYIAIAGGSSSGGERAASRTSWQHVVHDVGATGPMSEGGGEEGPYVGMDPIDRADDKEEQILESPAPSVDNPIYHIMHGTATGQTTDV